MINNMILDFASSLTGMIIPPVFDFVKKKYINVEREESIEATFNNLALSKPEFVDKYIGAYANLLDAKSRYFNRDVIGTPSLWIVNLRASITPIIVIFCLTLLFLEMSPFFHFRPELQRFIEFVISIWFGTRLSADD